MKRELKLSQQSREFLEDLNVYLFSSGKDWNEIEDISTELEVHLFEAEQNGKSIEKIIGESPKEYMKMVSSEMKVDSGKVMKYLSLFIFGSFAFTILPDVFEGNLSYSILQIIGSIIITALFLTIVLIGFNYISTIRSSIKTRVLVIVAISIIPGSLFFGLIYLNRTVATPIIHFGSIGTIIIGVISALFIISLSIWARTWLAIIMLLFLILPDFFLSLTSLSSDTQLISSSLITFGGIMIYLFILLKLENKRLD